MAPDLQAFKAAFKGDVVTPGDSDYDQAIARWARNAARRAAIVAFVKDAQDVALAVKYAKEASLAVAIKGGGHNPSGASSSEDGLVIDLSRYLNGVAVDAEKKLGYVGGGAVWETVDKTAIERGLATVGGTVNHVCASRLCSMWQYAQLRLFDLDWRRRVRSFEPTFAPLVCNACNRLILGGGYGWLSGEYGLAIDNLVQVRFHPVTSNFGLLLTDPRRPPS